MNLNDELLLFYEFGFTELSRGCFKNGDVCLYLLEDEWYFDSSKKNDYLGEVTREKMVYLTKLANKSIREEIEYGKERLELLRIAREKNNVPE